MIHYKIISRKWHDRNKLADTTLTCTFDIQFEIQTSFDLRDYPMNTTVQWQNT